MEQRSQGGFELEELRECNKSLVAKVEELEAERSAALDNMNTIIGKSNSHTCSGKNEELQQELNIMAKALELKGEDDFRQQEEARAEL